MQLYVTGRYGALNPGWHEEDAPEKASALAALIRSFGLRPRSVADVGCGTGAVLAGVKRALDEARSCPGCRYEGWDIAPDAIARAQVRAEDNLRFVAGDFASAGERVDLALCVDTFEHAGDDVAFLAALRERADWFVFRVPLELSALDVLRPARVLEARRRWGHRHAYSRELAFEVLDEAGYEVVGWRLHRVPPANDTLRRRLVDAGRQVVVSALGDLGLRLVGGWSVLVVARPRAGVSARPASPNGSA